MSTSRTVWLTLAFVVMYGTIAYLSISRIMLKLSLKRALSQAFDDNHFPQYVVPKKQEGLLPATPPQIYDQNVALYLADLQSRFYKYIDDDELGVQFDARTDTKLIQCIFSNTSNLPAAAVFLNEDVNSTVILFRGTHRSREKKLDLMYSMASPFFISDAPLGKKQRSSCVLEQLGGVKVHKGFLEYYQGFRDDLWKVLETMDLLKKPIYIMGHSLGGAVATLLAYDLLTAKPNAVPMTRIHVNVIGCPRTGDVNFAKSLVGVPLFRVSNTADMFCCIPFTKMPVMKNIRAYKPMSTFQHAGMGKMFHKLGQNLLEAHTLPFYQAAIRKNAFVDYEEK